MDNTLLEILNEIKYFMVKNKLYSEPVFRIMLLLYLILQSYILKRIIGNVLNKSK